MKTSTVVMFSAGLETATGLALIVVPALVGRVLLEQELSSAGVAVARVAGLGLLSLGLACWPGREGVPPPVSRALLTYNLLAALYLGYLRIGAGFVSYILLPAAALHAVLTILLVVERNRKERPKYFSSSSNSS